MLSASPILEVDAGRDLTDQERECKPSDADGKRAVGT
jgi:hypothetical protein